VSNQIELILLVQLSISADIELLKRTVFCDVVYTLYEKGVLCEEAILRWGRRGMGLEKESAASSNIIREQQKDYDKAVLGTSNSCIRSAMNHLP